MIVLALALALLAPQEKWEKVADLATSIIEVSGVRAQGDLRFVEARVSSLQSPRAVVASITVNCRDKTSAFTGEISVYVDGKLTESRPYPKGMDGFKPVANDPLAGPVAAHVCRK